MAELFRQHHYSKFEDGAAAEVQDDVLSTGKGDTESLLPQSPPTRRRPRSQQVSTANQDMMIEPGKNAPLSYYISKEQARMFDLMTRTKLKLVRRMDSVSVRVVSLGVLLLNVLLIIVELVLNKHGLPLVLEELLDIASLLCSAYFCAEVSLRVIGYGKKFFKQWFDVVDILVVGVSSVLTITTVLLHDYTFSRLLILGRVVQIFHWIRPYCAPKSLKQLLRTTVSRNRRRYMDEAFDLDLTYVTNRVIAMSFPSSGSESLYRNSIRDVGNFLDKKHYGHYRVYNLCSEKEYDPSHFHYQVQRVHIDDHNVPKFRDLVSFCDDVYNWMDEDSKNVIVVHCKGGKGRTGTMVAAWLVRSGLFGGAKQSLEYFSSRRTDKKKKGTKAQGVDTPSQSRYVMYYEKFLTQMNGNLPSATLRLEQLVINGLNKVHKTEVLDWHFQIFLMRQKVLEFSFQKNQEHQLLLSEKSSQIVFSVTKPVLLKDDVKFVFYCAIAKSVPSFQFWFHTSFILDNRLCFQKHELDNIQKRKNSKFYPDNFSIELVFEPSF